MDVMSAVTTAEGDEPKMTTENAETTNIAGTVGAQGTAVAPEKAPSKKAASPKKGAPKGQKQRPSIPRFRHHHSGVIERADPAQEIAHGTCLGHFNGVPFSISTQRCNELHSAFRQKA